MRERTIKDKLWHVMTICIFILLSIIVATYAIWSFYPYQVSDVKEPIEILNENKQIAVGDIILLSVELNKPNNIKPTGIVYITCTGGNLVTLLGNPQNLPTGKHTYINDKYRLPNKVTPGEKCKFNFKNTYRVNPIREITKEWTSQEFTVKE